MTQPIVVAYVATGPRRSLIAHSLEELHDEGYGMGYPVDWVDVEAIYSDGKHRLMEKAEWAETYCPSRQEAEEFVDERALAPVGSFARLRGLFRSDPDDPREKQIEDYMKPVYEWRHARGKAAR